MWLNQKVEHGRRLYFYEALGLCTEYMQGFSVTRHYVWDANEEGVGGKVLEGVPRPCTLSQHLCNITHLYVCENHEDLTPWRE